MKNLSDHVIRKNNHWSFTDGNKGAQSNVSYFINAFHFNLKCMCVIGMDEEAVF